MSKTFPPPIPPAYKKGVRYAQKVGTWVTGRNAHGLWGLPEHKRHLLIIKSKPLKSEHSNAGYRQQVRCLTCQTDIAVAIDGEFLQEQPTDQYLKETIENLDGVIALARKVRRIIAKEMVT